MRRGVGGEWMEVGEKLNLTRVGASSAPSTARPSLCRRGVHDSLSFFACKITKAKAQASSVTRPPALNQISWISSCGVSQWSIVSAIGPVRYHPIQSSTIILNNRRFKALCLYPISAARVNPALAGVSLSVAKSCLKFNWRGYLA